MKKFLSIILLTFTALASTNLLAASCGLISQKSDSKKMYAEVVSRGHMDLELVLVKKEFYSAKLKVTGGKGFHSKNLPTCEMESIDSLKWLNRNIATAITFDYDYHTAAYKVCSYDFRGKLIDSFTVCNYEVGD
jgi:hypothetical protein